MPRFQPASGILERAMRIHARERDRLEQLVRGATLELTGGSSVPGALTGGDVDLHLRVPPDGFAAAVETLRGACDVVLPEIWSDTLATFAIRGEPDVGIAVTPIGSEHDRRFVEAWSALRRDRQLLERYNAMKLEHAGGDDEAYRLAKGRFFDELDVDPRTG
jgi:hypothetical protein